MLKDRDRDGYWHGYRLGKCPDWIDLASIGKYFDNDNDDDNINNNINNSNNNK